MATHKTIFAGTLAALAFMMMVGLPGQARAAYYTCNGFDDLPCMVYGDDNENSVEWLLSTISNQFVDLTLLDEVDHQFWRYWGESTTQTAYSDSGKLKVVANEWDWVSNGTPPYGGNYYEGVGGYAKYYGDLSQIDYVTVSGYDSFVVYDAHDIISGNTWTWNTEDLWGPDKLVHFALWTVEKKVSEPMGLALLLTGLTFLTWRRNQRFKIA